MAEIVIGPLSEHLGDDEIIELAKALRSAGAGTLEEPDEDAEVVAVADNIDDDVLSEFLDRLEASDLACECYLPMEFDGRVEVGDVRYGSASALLEALDDMKDDLGIGEEEDEDAGEDEFGEIELVDKQMRQLWSFFYEGAQAALDRGLAFFVKMD